MLAQVKEVLLIIALLLLDLWFLDVHFHLGWLDAQPSQHHSPRLRH
jgi:hypothetical protein